MFKILQKHITIADKSSISIYLKLLIKKYTEDLCDFKPVRIIAGLN